MSCALSIEVVSQINKKGLYRRHLQVVFILIVLCLPERVRREVRLLPITPLNVLDLNDKIRWRSRSYSFYYSIHVHS